MAPRLVEQASEMAAQLADAHRDLAQVRSAEVRTRRAAWERCDDQASVTFRGMVATHAAEDMVVEGLILEGEIRALTVGLAHIDRQLAYPWPELKL